LGGSRLDQSCQGGYNEPPYSIKAGISSASE
jgi:hypothetical protein